MQFLLKSSPRHQLFAHTRPSSRSARSTGTPICQLQSPGGADVPAGCLHSVVGPSTFLDLESGMDYLKTLFRLRHFRLVSGVDLNPFSSSSHIQILSSNCTFDTIVVLVVTFIA